MNLGFLNVQATFSQQRSQIAKSPKSICLSCSSSNLAKFVST